MRRSGRVMDNHDWWYGHTESVNLHVATCYLCDWTSPPLAKQEARDLATAHNLRVHSIGIDKGFHPVGEPWPGAEAWWVDR